MSLSHGPLRLCSPAVFTVLIVAANHSRADWDLKVDAPNPALKPTIPAGKDFSISIPPARGNHRRILFPSTPSPFVALGNNHDESEYREIWDLRTKTKVGTLRGKYDWDDKMTALSPDGQLIAGKPGFRDVVEVRSTKTGRITQTINLPGPFHDFLDFGPTGTLLIGKIGDKAIRLYSIQTGEATLEIPLPGHIDRKAVAFSANRKYFVGISGWEGVLVIVDLISGDTVAQETVPKETCQGLAFADDGTELAALFEHFGKHRIIAWKATDGAEICNHELSDAADKVEAPAWYEEPGLSFLPDKAGFLLYGHAIVDRENGKRVYTLPFDDQNFNVGPRRWIDAERMLIPFGQNRMVRVAPVPKDKVQSAMKIVREGGNAADVGLPPLKPADFGSTRTLPMPASISSWTATPDPAPAARRLTSNPIRLKASEAEIRSVRIPGPGVPTAFLIGGPSTFAKQPKDVEGQPGWVERIDLAVGRSLGRFDTPGALEVLCVAADGTSILMVETKTKDRLDLLGVDGKPIVSWRPYEKESGEAKAVTWAEFVDGKTLLTLSGTGRLVLWSVPDLKAKYIIDGSFQGKPLMSPGRKHVIGAAGDTLVMLDAMTGAALGELPGSSGVPGQRVELKATAFSDDGKEFAALFSNAKLLRYDVATGKPLSEFTSPAIGDKLGYFGKSYLLVDGKALVDLQVKRALWNYQSGPSAERSPDGRFWFLASKFPTQPATLAGAVVPERGMERITAMVANPSTPASLKPGWRVSLDVRIGDAPGGKSEEIKRHVTDQLTAKLKANGIVVAPNQKVSYVVRVDQVPQNDNLQLRMIGPGAAPGGPFNAQNIITIPIVDLICNLELYDGLGQPIPCVSPQTLGMRYYFGILHIPAGEDVAQYIKKQQWLGINGWSDSLAPPYFVSRQGSEIVRLPGFTNLSQIYAQ